MATLQQSLMIQKNIANSDQRSVSAAIIFIKRATKFIAKHNEKGRDNSKGPDVGTDNGTKEIIDILKKMDGDLEKIKKDVASIDTHASSIVTALSDFKKSIDKIKKNTTPAKGSSFNNGMTIFENIVKIIAASVGSLMVLRSEGLGGIIKHFRDNVLGTSEQDSSNTTSASIPEENQAKLDEALNNLSAGINNWLATRKDLEAITQRRTDIKGVLSDSLASWQDTINEKLTKREDNKKISDRRDDMKKSFKDGAKEWQKAINAEMLDRGKNETILNRRQSIKDNFNASLEGWRQAVSDSLANRGSNQIIATRRSDIKTALNSLMTGWQETINEKLAERSENRKIEKRRKGMQDSLKASVEEWQKAISETLGNRVENEEILARREGMRDAFVNSLEQLQQAISENLTNRKTNEQIVEKRDEMVSGFKKTLEEIAGFLKTVFQEPAKAVAMQFVYMGAVTIFVLRRMESAIDDVAAALGSLQFTGSTLVSSAQDTIAEAEKALQSIPSAEKSLGSSANAEGSGPSTSAASTQGSLSMQQSADAYEISSQKAGEITAMSGNQAGGRQTIINMNSNMPVNASITNGMDMETFLRQLGIGVDMAMRSAAEGVPL